MTTIAFVASKIDEAQAALADLHARYGETPVEQADVIVALGGDGFMLRTLHRHLASGKRYYGMKLGIAFQLVDDALDYSADQATLGKTVGDDFREGKITLPVLVAHQAGDASEQAFWRRTIEQLEQTDADLDEAMALIGRRGAIAATLDRAWRFVHEAKAALTVFPDSPERRALLDVADYTVQRAR